MKNLKRIKIIFENMKKQLCVLSIVVLIISGCYYDKYDKLYPPPTVTVCDSTAVTYSVTVTGILNSYCMECHSTANSGGSGGILLDSYSALNNYVSSGQLMGDVKQQSGFFPMPPSIKLSDCDIAKLQKWVNDGAPNN